MAVGNGCHDEEGEDGVELHGVGGVGEGMVQRRKRTILAKDCSFIGLEMVSWVFPAS